LRYVLFLGLAIAAGCSQPGPPAPPVDFSNGNKVDFSIFVSTEDLSSNQPGADLAGTHLDLSSHNDGATTHDASTPPTPDLMSMTPPDLSGVPPTPDMTVVHDLSVPPPVDMSAVYGCRGFAACVGNCYDETNTQDEYDQCVQDDCIPVTSTQGQNLLDDAFQCGINHCVDVFRCSDANDTSQDCLVCEFNATAYLLGFSCSPTHDPDCNTSACTSTVNACEADTP
jgi:hypothetical protein